MTCFSSFFFLLLVFLSLAGLPVRTPLVAEENASQLCVRAVLSWSGVVSSLIKEVGGEEKQLSLFIWEFFLFFFFPP